MSENKKIIGIIKELDACEYDFYFNDFIENFSNDLLIDGGKEYTCFNDDLLKKIKTVREDFDIYSFEGFNSEIEFFNYYLSKKNGSTWTTEEVNTFKNNFSYCNILKIVTGLNFEKTILTGYSQGERIQVFFNIDKVKNDDLELLQVLYFGGCNEVIYSYDAASPEAIFESDYINFITHEYNKNKIIDIIKNDEKTNNIVLYQQKERKVTQIYFEKI